MLTIRRKYTAGGDIWEADADTEPHARERAAALSEEFPHGAVYITRHVGTERAVIACYRRGLPSSWAWWSTAAEPRLALVR